MPILPPLAMFALVAVILGTIVAIALCSAAARGDRQLHRALDERDAQRAVRPLSSAVDRVYED